MKTLTIAARFCGPASSSNGGYFAGLVATLAKYPPCEELAGPQKRAAMELFERWVFRRAGGDARVPDAGGAAAEAATAGHRARRQGARGRCLADRLFALHDLQGTVR